MDNRSRSAVVTGTILVAAGVFFLVTRFVPGIIDTTSWPFIVIGVGAIFMAISLVTWTPGLAVPACILGGIGGLLYWQNANAAWWTWSYAWALIPGFVGVGVAVNELMEGRPLRALTEGGWPVIISLLLFFLFGSFFGALPLAGPWWALVLIAIGVLVILRPIVRGAGKRSARERARADAEHKE
jgi:hypothetical protein